MTDREIQRLNRRELLEILIEQGREIEELRAQNEEKDALLRSREIDVREAGTISEAAFRLNGIYQATEDAAQQYLENLQRLDNERKSAADHVIEDAQEKADKIIREAKVKAGEIIRNAELMRQKKQDEAVQYMADAEKEAVQYKADAEKTLAEFRQYEKTLKEMLGRLPS